MEKIKKIALIISMFICTGTHISLHAAHESVGLFRVVKESETEYLHKKTTPPKKLSNATRFKNFIWGAGEFNKHYCRRLTLLALSIAGIYMLNKKINQSLVGTQPKPEEQGAPSFWDVFNSESEYTRTTTTTTDQYGRTHTTTSGWQKKPRVPQQTTRSASHTARTQWGTIHTQSHSHEFEFTF